MKKGTGTRSALPVERLVVVAKELAKCQSHDNVERHLSERWGITRRQIRQYIRRVYDDWAEQAEADRPFVRERMRAAFEKFYETAMAKGELRAAVTALDRLAKLDGAYAPVQVEVSAAVGAAITQSEPDKIRERIRVLAARHGLLTAKGT